MRRALLYLEAHDGITEVGGRRTERPFRMLPDETQVK